MMLWRERATRMILIALATLFALAGWSPPPSEAVSPSSGLAAEPATMFGYDAAPTATTPSANARTDTRRERPAPRTSPGVVRLVPGFGLAAKAATETIDAAALSSEQTTNLARYARKLPSGAGQPQIERLAGGSVRFSTDVPGRVPGSYARYIKTVDESGATSGYVKETYGPNSELIHTKNKYGPGG